MFFKQFYEKMGMIILLIQNIIYGMLDRLEDRKNFIENELNKYRLACGLNALRRDETLDRVAQKYAEELGECVKEGHHIGHDHPKTKSTFESRVDDGGYECIAIAENIGKTRLYPCLCKIGGMELRAFVKLQHSPGHNINKLLPYLNEQGIGIADILMDDGDTYHILVHMFSQIADINSLPKEAKQNFEKKILKITDTNYHLIIDDIEKKFMETFQIMVDYEYRGIKRSTILDEIASQKLKRILACSNETSRLNFLVEKKVKEHFGQEIVVRQFYHTWRVYKSWGAFYKTHKSEYKNMARGKFGISVLINADKSYHVCVINISASLK